MYKSPIEIIYAQTQTQIEGDIFKAIQSYGIAVDKNELIQALAYDRDQYSKGYTDGKAGAMADLVRCKDCKYYQANCCFNRQWDMESAPEVPLVREDDFCSYGERKDNERKAD